MIDNTINYRLNTPNERLRFLRSLTQLTRKDITEKYNLPIVTLNKWETGFLPLSDKGITKCINIYKLEGVIATEDWVKSGNGPLPYILDDVNQVTHSGEYKNFENDVNYFQKNYVDCIVYKVRGEEMLPIYKENDIVIGYEYKENYKKLHNQICIITLENTNETLLRKLHAIEDKQYNLYCTNPLIMIENPILYNVKIQRIAPVIWHAITEKNK